MQTGEIYCSEGRMVIREIKDVTSSTIKFLSFKSMAEYTCYIDNFHGIKIEEENQLSIGNVVMDNFMIFNHGGCNAITTAMIKKGRASSRRSTCKNNIVIYDKTKRYKCENVQISLNKTTEDVKIIYKKLNKLYNILI